MKKRFSFITTFLLLCFGISFSLSLFADTRFGVSYGQRWTDDVFANDILNNDVAVGIRENESVSAALEFKYSAVADWQFYLNRFESEAKTTPEPTNFSSSVLQFGGVRWLDEGTVRPYIGSTAGVTQLKVVDDSLTRFSMSFMAGFHWDISKNVGLRTEARWLGTLVNSDTSLSCVNGQCRIEIQSGIWAQTEVNAAVYLQF